MNARTSVQWQVAVEQRLVEVSKAEPIHLNRCRLIATLGAGDALGEMALLKQGGLRTVTVQATTDCEVC